MSSSMCACAASMLNTASHDITCRFSNVCSPVCLQNLFKQFAAQQQQTPRLSVETGGKYMFHYLIEQGVIFLALADRGYPKKLAFQYLEELSGEFGRLYGSQVETVSRPYAFIKFGA